MVPTEELEGYGRRPRVVRAATLFVASMAAIALVYLALRPAETPPVAPEFELPLLTGGTLSSRDLEGSPVVLNFFASWCAPCREEAPLLEAAWRRYRADGVRFVGVDVDDTAEDARRFVREFDITYPIVRDEEDRLVKQLRVNGLPQTFFIDHDWRLLRVASGEAVGDETRDVVPLGAISAEELHSNVRLLLERAREST